MTILVPPFTNLIGMGLHEHYHQAISFSQYIYMGVEKKTFKRFKTFSLYIWSFWSRLRVLAPERGTKDFQTNIHVYI